MGAPIFTTTEQVLALPSVTWDERRSLPESPGLYFVLTDDQITYIGSTVRTLRRRWLYRQEDLKRFRYFGDFRIAYVATEDAASLDQAERDLLRWFRPPLNVFCVPDGYRNMAHEWPHLRWDRPHLPHRTTPSAPPPDPA